MFSLDFEDVYITEDDFCNGDRKWFEICISFDSPEVFYYFVVRENNVTDDMADNEQEEQ